MFNHMNVTPLEVVKLTTATLLNLIWNAFKAGLSAVLLLVAGSALWGAWYHGALSFDAIIIPAFLLCLACAPWVIPRLPLGRRKAHERSIFA